MNPIFIILLLLTNLVFAQKEGKKSTIFEPRFDALANAGLSIPLGKYRLLTDESDGRAAAAYGLYAELAVSMTPLPSSPWRTGLTIGYMHHPFNVAKSKEHYNLPIFEANSWNSFYMLLGISILSKKKLCYGMGFDVGILGYAGGNITSGQIINDTMLVNNWQYPTYTAIAIKGSAFLGYNFSSKLSIFVNMSVLYASGLRYGAHKLNRYLLDTQKMIIHPSIQKESFSHGMQMSIFTINLGISFRYKFHKEADSFNYQFNINENR